MKLRQERFRFLLLPLVAAPEKPSQRRGKGGPVAYPPHSPLQFPAQQIGGRTRKKKKKELEKKNGHFPPPCWESMAADATRRERGDFPSEQAYPRFCKVRGIERAGAENWRKQRDSKKGTGGKKKRKRIT